MTNALASDSPVRTVRRRRSFFDFAPIAAVAVLVLISVLLWRENVQLRRRFDRVQARLDEQNQRLAKSQALIEMLTAPGVQRVSLSAASTKPQPHAQCMYKANSGHLLLLAGGLAPLPAGKTYQLWIMPMNGSKPVPAGTFKPDARGDAMVMDPPIPVGVEAKAFAVTIEPEGGAATPTMPFRMMGAGQ